MTTINKNKTTTITITALFAAMTVLATLFFKIPIGLGYIHLGDALVILAALMLPRSYACFSAGVGAALADIIGGFAVWAPWSLAIKIIVVLMIGTLILKSQNTQVSKTETENSGKKPTVLVMMVVSFVLAAIWTAAAYYVAEGVIYGNWVVPLAGIPFNLLQVAVGAVIAAILYKAFERYIS